MVAYAKRMKRFKVAPDRANIPVGTHLLLSGILVSVNGVILDIGLPGWMTEHLPKDSDKALKSRLKSVEAVRCKRHVLQDSNH